MDLNNEEQKPQGLTDAQIREVMTAMKHMTPNDLLGFGYAAISRAVEKYELQQNPPRRLSELHKAALRYAKAGKAYFEEKAEQGRLPLL